jgi:glycosyltransferase involved in cell wall biosynthesis
LDAKLSIIVPVYNAEKHLKECLCSIINQTLKEIQIIIINDGSSDNSKEIILDYVSKDDRILFIDSTNEGVSAARNKGIAQASGKYLGFVDADDYLDERMYQQLFEITEGQQAPMAICNAIQVANKQPFRKRLQLKNDCFFVSDKKKVMLDFLSFKYDSANWNKIYLSDIIRKNNLKFHKQLSIWEDLLFNLQFVIYTNKIVVLEEGLYYYRIHPTSVIAASKLSVSEQYNLFYKSYLSFCNKNSLHLEKETFIQERAETCISNLFILLKLRMKAKPGFFLLTKQFYQELKVLNREIYKGAKPLKTGNAPFYLLLKYRLYKIFAFMYVAKNRFSELFLLNK